MADPVKKWLCPVCGKQPSQPAPICQLAPPPTFFVVKVCDHPIHD